MSRFISCLLIFLFITGTIIITFNNDVSASETVEDYWNTKKSMAYERESLGIAVVDNKIYAIGGHQTYASIIGVNEKYDPKTDTWTTMTPMPTPRTYLTVAVYQDKIYCIGGVVGFVSVRTSYTLDLCRVVEVYDTVADSWSSKASCPFTCMGSCASVVDGQIFILNGSYDLYMYDISEDLWVEKSTMPECYRALGYYDPVVVDNKIVFVAAIPFNDIDKKMVMYDPKTDVWSERQEKAFDATLGGSIAVVTNGVYAPQNFYVLTGSELQVYDSARNTWAIVSTIPTSRINYSAAVMDDVLYVVGGKMKTSIDTCSLNEQYVLDYSSTAQSSIFSLDHSVIIVILILTVSTVGAGLFYFRFRKKRIIN